MHLNNNTNSSHIAVEDEELSQSPRPVQKRMFTDDFSLYDAENSHQSGDDASSHAQTSLVSGSPRTTCSSMAASASPGGLMLETDDEEEDVMLPSADNSPVSFKVLLEKKNRRPLLKMDKSFDDAHHDTNSMDSGYGNSSNQFRFVQPTGIAPRRLDSGIASPLASGSASKQTGGSFSVFNSCSSQGSLESMEEDYLDMFRLEDEDNANAGSFRLPSSSLSQKKSDMPNISSLICGAIKQQTPERKTPNGPKMRVRRCLMMDESTALNSSCTDDENKENSSPMEIIRRVSKVQQKSELVVKRTNLQMLDANQQGKCFKRPEPLMFSPVQSKRYKSEVFAKTVSFSGARTADPRLEAFSFDETVAEKCVAVSVCAAAPLQRAVSMNETMIKNALSRSSSDPDLIGDFTKPFCLPHIAGRHNDLRSISVDTMSELVRGNFDDSVASFKVIDCRYPYEFEGGHIRHAKNLYTQEQILEELVTPISGEATLEGGSDTAGKRHILVFHCEFSSERGPKL